MLALRMALLYGSAASGVAGLSLANSSAQPAQNLSSEVTFVLINNFKRHEFDCWFKNFNAITSHAPVVTYVLDRPVEDHVKTHVNSDNANLRIDSYYLTHYWGNHRSLARGRRWPPERYQRAIWEAVKMQFESGAHSVLHSDTDAFFHTADIWTFLREDKLLDTDLVSSVDHCYPGDVCSAWNLQKTLNPGFMLFRNTPAMNEVIDHLIKLWDDGKQPADKHDHSDLFMLNRYLAYDSGCTWEPSYVGTAGGATVRFGSCRESRLKMAALSDSMVCHGWEGKYVSHGHGAIARAHC